MHRTLTILKHTFREFSDDDGPSMAAALAYYTIFSLAPLLVLIILLVGLFVEPQQVEGQVVRQIGSLVGPEAAEQIQAMVRRASEHLETGGLLTTLLGLGALLFGATGAFAQLQHALNKAWEVKPDPEQGGLKNFIVKRVLSLGMVLGVAFLLLVSLVMSTALSAFGAMLAEAVPFLGPVMLFLFNAALSLAVITVLFAALFKVLPDAEIGWRDVWVGAAVTALLFVAGKFLIGFYLGRSDPGSVFGAAGSLAVILVWIYYSAMILLLGAEFTQVWTTQAGRQIAPSEGAVPRGTQAVSLPSDTVRLAPLPADDTYASPSRSHDRPSIRP